MLDMVDRNTIREIVKEFYNTDANNIEEIVNIYKLKQGIMHLTGRIDRLIKDTTKKEIKELFQ